MDLAEVKGRRRTGNKKDGFIIKASDLDWLIAAVEQLTAERDRLRAALKEIMDNRADYCTTCAENVDTAVAALYVKEAK